MDDYISRTDVIQMINEANAWHPESAHVLGPLRREIMNHQPADVRPVARGHWITEEEAIQMGDILKKDTCAVCGACDWDCIESKDFNFCPNCGAVMRPEHQSGGGMTNADRIRAMTDEELSVEFDNYICRHVESHECGAQNGTVQNCSQCKLDWLRKEADNG